MKNIAVVLSGCGYLDGTEITEAVSLIIELDRHKCSYSFYAPNTEFTPTSHFDNVILSNNKRNTLEESARITRGLIKSLDTLNPEKYDGLAIPGGFGVVKNLSTWAIDGPSCSVNKDIKQNITAFHSESKPILALCIAPILVAKSLKDSTPCLTLGTDPSNAADLEKAGAEHIDCLTMDFVSDRENKLVSTPAYMHNTSPYEVFKGISKACSEFIEMC